VPGVIKFNGGHFWVQYLNCYLGLVVDKKRVVDNFENHLQFSDYFDIRYL